MKQDGAGALISAHQWGGSGGLSPGTGRRSEYQGSAWVTLLIPVLQCLSSHRNSSVPSLEQGKDHVSPETVSTTDSSLTA